MMSCAERLEVRMCFERWRVEMSREKRRLVAWSGVRETDVMRFDGIGGRLTVAGQQTRTS